MDVSHVSLISIELPADNFESYKCESAIDLSFNIDTLTKVLKSADNNDTLTIRTEDAKEDIEILITSQNEDKNTRFKLKPIEIDANSVSIPEHTYKAKLSLSSAALSQLVKHLSEVDDAATVRCNEGNIVFSVSDSLLDCTTTFIEGGAPSSADEEVVVDVSEGCRVSYALRYLKAISAASSLSPRVSLSFSPHFPLLVEYELNEGGFVRFYLAPKVEEDDTDEEI
ncbi:proliferating cell nuclear antigen [Tritrichomonas foetus]|uniref:DNA sliding clamp PCNA n=1 Tax=Tritrichomonas foetus TaxID=1144522 RepID=A0A1J4L284_9EUKA|nr:proliferating cell nuclear antigen [Tritrichomonas foetus]|eukprot:OHT16054.1 proliferating cell nuclear antigen [Tritrichomonas foetus]